MHAIEFFLAVLFITNPADKLNVGAYPEIHGFLGPRITVLARQWELLDARENNHFKKPIEFVSDLKCIHERYEKLRDAPMLAEVERFPDLITVNQSLLTNRSYRDDFARRTELSAKKISSILIEADRLFRVYDYLRDARCEYFYVSYRREALAKLRNQLGSRAFTTGQMPLHLPIIQPSPRTPR